MIQSSTTPDPGTTWESNKNTINITNKSYDVSPFPAGDHKAAMNRHETMRNTRHKNTNDPQQTYRLGTVCKNNYLECLNRFHGTNLTISSDVDQDTQMFGLHERHGCHMAPMPINDRRLIKPVVLICLVVLSSCFRVLM